MRLAGFERAQDPGPPVVKGCPAAVTGLTSSTQGTVPTPPQHGGEDPRLRYGRLTNTGLPAMCGPWCGWNLVTETAEGSWQLHRPLGGGARCLPPPPTAGPSYQLISSSSRRQVLRDPLLLPDGRAWRWERRPWRQNCLGSNPCDPSGGSSPSPGALWCVASRCHSQCLGQEVTRPGVGVAGGQGQKFRGHDNNLSGVTDLWAPLSHAGRGRVVLGHTLNTL